MGKRPLLSVYSFLTCSTLMCSSLDMTGDKTGTIGRLGGAAETAGQVRAFHLVERRPWQILLQVAFEGLIGIGGNFEGVEVGED